MRSFCRQCQAEFQITDDDLAFYERVSPVFNGQKELIPPPTLCPDCRQQRRTVWRNERRLYHRKCDRSGRPIVSPFAPDKPYKVYGQQEWWDDANDARVQGRDFDFTRPFFEQFSELMREVPLLFSYNLDSQNSEFCNWTSYLKNCYMLSSSNHDEDCYYGFWINDSRNCVDCAGTTNCELCYGCIDCSGCYDCRSCHDCVTCVSSMFLKHCTGCKNCFGCVNLSHKEYCFWNEQLTQEEYAAKLQEFRRGSHAAMLETEEFLQKHMLRFPVRSILGTQNENVTGNGLIQCRNMDTCFDCFGCEDCKYCYQLQQGKDCYDVFTWGRPGELLYECGATGDNAFQNCFTSMCRGSSNILYCFACMFSEHLFGCIGLKKARYCILNKQYTKEEYDALVPKIIEHMRSTPLRQGYEGQAGEWGEYFPISLSPFCYNEAVSQDYYPLEREEVLRRGWGWREDDVRERKVGAVPLPDDVADATETICESILLCEATGAPYKIIPQEFRFLQDHHIPLPRLCPEQRHLQRMAIRNPRHLWDRFCAGCNKAIRTSYAPERPETVYCEECYLKSVY